MEYCVTDREIISQDENIEPYLLATAVFDGVVTAVELGIGVRA